MVGQQFGWVKIISSEKRWNKKQVHCYVLTQCDRCGSIQWQLYCSLKSGKSKGCQSCSQPRQIPLWLDRRLAAAKQRCENPNDGGYHNYGARGIKFAFTSVTEAGLYLIKTFGLPPKELEIDRINNNLIMHQAISFCNTFGKTTETKDVRCSVIFLRNIGLM